MAQAVDHAKFILRANPLRTFFVTFCTTFSRFLCTSFVGPATSQNLVVKFDGEICGGVLVENADDGFPQQKKLESLLPNFAGSSPPISPKTSPTSLWKSFVHFIRRSGAINCMSLPLSKRFRGSKAMSNRHLQGWPKVQVNACRLQRNIQHTIMQDWSISRTGANLTSGGYFPHRVHAKGVVLCERTCFCLLSTFYDNAPF